MITEKVIDTAKNEILDITAKVLEAVKESGIKDGIVTVEAEDVSCGIGILEKDNPAICQDLWDETKRLVPSRITFKYEESPDGSAGRIKSCIFGSAVTVIVKDGKLASDKKGIFIIEYNGPETRKIYICTKEDK